MTVAALSILALLAAASAAQAQSSSMPQTTPQTTRPAPHFIPQSRTDPGQPLTWGQAGARGPRRPSLTEIERNFQRAEEPMRLWPSERIAEMFDREQENLTETEIALLNGLIKREILHLNNPYKRLVEFEGIRSAAWQAGHEKYALPENFQIPPHVSAMLEDEIRAMERDYAVHRPGQKFNRDAYIASRMNVWRGNDGHLDAFRHAYWSALMAKHFGSEWATQYTTAHEAGGQNPVRREAMDLYNNSVGIRIASEHPNASDTELADLVKSAIEGGEMVVIGRSRSLQWSNQVGVWEHGLTTTALGAGGKPAPSSLASPQ